MFTAQAWAAWIVKGIIIFLGGNLVIRLLATGEVTVAGLVLANAALTAIVLALPPLWRVTLYLPWLVFYEHWPKRDAWYATCAYSLGDQISDAGGLSVDLPGGKGVFRAGLQPPIRTTTGFDLVVHPPIQFGITGLDVVKSANEISAVLHAHLGGGFSVTVVPGHGPDTATVKVDLLEVLSTTRAFDDRDLPDGWKQ